MRAILIDPKAKTITEVEYDGDYRTINKLIGCDLFTVITIDHYADESTESLFIDDEGLLSDPKYFFLWKDYPQPLPGKGLILGCDCEGESTATNYGLEYVRDMVAWAELKVLGFKTKEGEEEIGGKTFFTIRQTPMFGPPDEEES